MRSDDAKKPPFEAESLRKELVTFLNTPFEGRKLGDFQWGVYAFFDYDGEPIYVGQTNEKLRTRIRRHLTNQRTDAVAMSVLDPFEVFEIQAWPLPALEGINKKSPKEQLDKATADLNALEYAVFMQEVAKSRFKAVLNEKDPPKPSAKRALPASRRGRIVSDEVLRIRSHPDVRLARRASTLARLAQVISERQVQYGLRRTLLTQAKRLQWLADRRLGSVSPNEEDDEP